MQSGTLKLSISNNQIYHLTYIGQDANTIALLIAQENNAENGAIQSAYPLCTRIWGGVDIELSNRTSVSVNAAQAIATLVQLSLESEV